VREVAVLKLLIEEKPGTLISRVMKHRNKQKHESACFSIISPGLVMLLVWVGFCSTQPCPIFQDNIKYPMGTSTLMVILDHSHQKILEHVHYIPTLLPHIYGYYEEIPGRIFKYTK